MAYYLEGVLKYCRDDDRICPKPQEWSKLWHMLPNRRRAGGGWHPPAPLILSGWWTTSDKDKQLRLQEHVRYADEHGELIAVAEYLSRLPESAWHHVRD